MGADTAITAWVRDASGKRDMTGETLTVHLFPYGKGTELGASIEATSAEEGKASFTITEGFGDSYLQPGLYRLSVKADDTEVIYSGLLEVV